MLFFSVTSNAGECDPESIDRKENSLLSSYIATESSERIKPVDFIEVEFFGAAIVLPNRYQVRFNGKTIHLTSLSTQMYYQGCTISPFFSGSIY